MAVGELFFPMTSPNIVESKSLKLYLNSLNDKAFENAEVVRLAIRGDLSAAVGGQVKVLVQELSTVTETDGNLLPIPLSECQSKNIDDVGLGEGNVFNKRLFAAGPDSRLIKVVPGAKMAKCAVRSDLFRSNCPVTGQPDWASVEIRYRGRRLDEAALLHYLFSYRHHRAFHEECAERIFRDVYQACKPDSLWLGLNFLRRGGLDINVYRSTEPMEAYGLRRRMLRQ